MRANKLIAAAVSAVIPFSTGIINSAFPAVHAEQTEMPDWIPTNYDEALDFYNTYGATHIGKNINDNDTVCIVLAELYRDEDEYSVEISETEMTEVCHEKFRDENAYLCFDVIVYTDPGRKSGVDELYVELLRKGELLESYDFYDYSKTGIVEQDIYSWLPDCATEYVDYVKENGEVSTHGEYLVLCLDDYSGLKNSWYEDTENDNSVIDETYISYCQKIGKLPVQGGVHRVIADKFKEDGRVKLSYYYGNEYEFQNDLSIGSLFLDDDCTVLSPDVVSGRIIYSYDDIPCYFIKTKLEKAITADCMVLDNGKTVLLPDDARVRLIDVDTGKAVKVSNMKDKEFLFRQQSLTGAMYPINPMQTNNSILDNSKSFIYNKDDFDGFWNDKGADQPEINIYDNGAVDILFRIDLKEDGLAPDKIRVTVYDSDTGELIPDEILAAHPYGFGTDIRIRSAASPDGWMYTGPVYSISSNKQVIDTNLSSLYKDADSFAFLCEDEHEVELHDNGSMDLVFRTKIKVTGDVNSDDEFNLADLVTLNKWLHGDNENPYFYINEGDFCLDGKIDVFDLCAMRKKLVGMSGNTSNGFEAKYIRADSKGGDISYPQTKVIKDAEELTSYIKSQSKSFYTTSLEEAVKNYDADWFSNHKLLVVVLEEGSGSNRHKVTAVTKDYVEIERILPEVGTCDMAEWFILIETDKGFDISDNFEVKITNKQNR